VGTPIPVPIHLRDQVYIAAPFSTGRANRTSSPGVHGEDWLYRSGGPMMSCSGRRSAYAPASPIRRPPEEDRPVMTKRRPTVVCLTAEAERQPGFRYPHTRSASRARPDRVGFWCSVIGLRPSKPGLVRFPARGLGTVNCICASGHRPPRTRCSCQVIDPGLIGFQTQDNWCALRNMSILAGQDAVPRTLNHIPSWSDKDPQDAGRKYAARPATRWPVIRVTDFHHMMSKVHIDPQRLPLAGRQRPACG